jgi:hypothetical protein
MLLVSKKLPVSNPATPFPSAIDTILQPAYIRKDHRIVIQP